MDILTANGYLGQNIEFIGADKLGYISGIGICIHDLTSGPKEILWRHDYGIKTFKFSPSNSKLVLSHDTNNSNIEVLSCPSFSLICELKNPAIGKIPSLSFSFDGEKLVGLSDYLDHKLIVWDVSNQEIILTSQLKTIFTTCKVNPINANSISLISSTCIQIAEINEMYGDYSVQFKPIELDSLKNLPEDKQNYNPKLPFIQFVDWAPENCLILCLSNGAVACIDTVSANILFYFYLTSDDQSHGIPIMYSYTTEFLIVSDSNGYLYWYDLDPLNTPIMNKTQNGQLNLIPRQVCKLNKDKDKSKRITCMANDEAYQNLVVSSCDGNIFKLPIAIKIDDEKIEEVEDKDEYNEVAIETKKLETPHPFMTLDSVVITSSKFIELKLLQLSDGKIKPTINTVSILATANVDGTIKFWKTPNSVSENSHPESAVSLIRKSTPGVLTPLNSIVVCEPNVAPITLLCPFPVLCKNGGRYLLVGNAKGWVEVWLVEAIEDQDDDNIEESDFESGLMKLKASIIFQQHLFTSAVTSASFSKGTPYISISSFQSSHIYFLHLKPKEIEILGFLSIDKFYEFSNPSIIGCLIINNFLVVAEKSGDVSIVDAIHIGSGLVPILNDNPRSKTIKKFGNISSICASETNKLIICDEDSKTVKLIDFVEYYTEGTENIDFEGLFNLTLSEIDNLRPCIESSTYHDMMTCSATSKSGHLLITGGLSGALFLWNCADLSLVNTIRLHNNLVLGVSEHFESGLVQSNSTDGSVFITYFDVPTHIAPPKSSASQSRCILEYDENQLNLLRSKIDASNNKFNSSDKNSIVTLWSENDNLKKLETIKNESKLVVADCKATLSSITSRLHKLLEYNNGLTELEKLDRTEFVVDTKGKQDLISKYQESCDKLKDDFNKTNLSNEVVAARIRSSCWDPLEFHSSQLLPLQPESVGKFKLTSFPVLKPTEYQIQTIEKVKRLRAIEIRTQRSYASDSSQKLSGGCSKTSWPGSLNSDTLNTSWITAEGKRWLNFDQIEFAKNLAVEESSSSEEAPPPGGPVQDQGADAEEEEANESKLVDENHSLHLLYPPLAIRSDVQKRTQIVLLNDVLHSIKTKFNEYFMKLYREKEDVIASIDSRNVRIKEILDELKLNEECYKAELKDSELADSMITVNDSEIVNRPYETATAKAQRLKEEELKRKRELEKDAENIKGRALDEMMHGTLDVKKDVLVDTSSIVRPDWMINLLPSEMNESQLKEYEEFEAKLKSIQEEQAKYRKTLEIEQKKLRAEIADLCKAFDEKLLNMIKYKLITHREIIIHELYISRISTHLVDQDFMKISMKESLDNIKLLNDQSREVKEQLAKIITRGDNLKNQIAIAQEDGRSMDRTFRRDLQQLCNTNFDQDSLKVFTDLYKQRQYAADYDEGNGEEDGDDDRSEATSLNQTNNRNSKTTSKKQSSRNTSKQTSKQVSKMKASKGNVSTNKDSMLGPLQEAAQAIDNPVIKQMMTKDPFYRSRFLIEKKKRRQEAQIPLLIAQSLEIDCPDGFNVDQHAWSKLQELRFLRIQKEIDEKMFQFRLIDVKSRMDEVQAQDTSIDNKLQILNSSLQTMKQNNNSSDNNLEIIVALKQGQDEVDKDSLVTDYSQALLIPTSIIHKYNGTINHLGKEKIHILTKIKEFRRKINLIDWESNQMQLESIHLDEYFTDLQLIRVTRDFQRVIRSDSDAGSTKVIMSKL